MSNWPKSQQTSTLLGDAGFWAETLPTLWRGVAWPDGPWTTPQPDWKGLDPSAAPRDDAWGDDRKRVRYWAPLLHLTWGALGWVDPALGSVRWVKQGMPTEDPALQVMRRWWGENVQSLWQWAHETHSLQDASQLIAQATASTYIDGHDAVTRQAPVGKLENPEFTMYRRRDIFNGGGDGLHLSYHVPGSLIGHEPPPQPHIVPSLHHQGGTAQVVLLLDHYAGWYRTLHEAGATLPPRPDGRNWRVTVVVKPLGSLGEYRLSKLTGRWFSGRHRHHLLGWAGDI